VYSTRRGADALVFSSGRLLSRTPLPILTTSAGFASLAPLFGGSYVSAEWDAQPKFAGFTVGDLMRLVRRENRVASKVTTVLAGSSMSSQLGSLVPGARRVVARGLAPIYVVMAAVALVGLGVLLGVGVLKLDRQSFEIAVLKTRGVRTRELLAMQSVEVGLAALIALPLSLALALALATLGRDAHGPGLPGAVFPIRLNGVGIGVATAALGVAALALVLVSVPHLRRTVTKERQRLSRPGRPAWLRLPYELILILVGGVGYAELRRHGTLGSGGSLDPFVLVVPSLLLIGGGALTVRLMVWGFSRGERAADRLGSPALYLGLRRLSRSGASASLALLIVLSAGLLAFASSLRMTALTRNQDAAREQIGADWSALVNPPAQVTPAAKRLSANSTLVFYGSAQTTRSPPGFANLIGVDPSTYSAGGWWQSQDASLTLSSLLQRLKTPELGVRLPPGTTVLELRAVTPAAHRLGFWAVAQTSAGAVVDRYMGAIRGGPRIYRAPMADAARLFSVVVGPLPAAGLTLSRPARFTVSFDRLTAFGSSGSRTVDLSSWRGLNTGGSNVATQASSSGELRATFTVINNGPTGAIAAPARALPAVVGGPEPGRPRSAGLIQVGVLQVPLRVVGSLRAFPALYQTEEPIIAVSVRALTERFEQIMQSPNGGAFAVLAMGSATPVTAARAAGFQVLDVARASTIEAQLASSPENLAIGMEFAASVAGALLAVVALALGVYFGGRRHEYEFASLEAIGGRPSDVFSTLAVEHGLMLVWALPLGCGVGVGLFALALPSVAPAPPQVPDELLVDWPAILIASAAAVSAIGVAIAVATARARNLSPVSVLRGEPE
jgi:hypothetical protein